MWHANDTLAKTLYFLSTWQKHTDTWTESAEVEGMASNFQKSCPISHVTGILAFEQTRMCLKGALATASDFPGSSSPTCSLSGKKKKKKRTVASSQVPQQEVSRYPTHGSSVERNTLSEAGERKVTLTKNIVDHTLSHNFAWNSNKKNRHRFAIFYGR